jgi:hypothetical protein
MGRLLHALRTYGAALVAWCLGRYARTHPDGDHDGRVDRGYMFNCLQPTEPVLGTRDSFGAVLSQKWVLEPRRHTTAPKLLRVGRREPEPQGHVAAPELPQVRRRDPESRGHVAAPELSQAGSVGIGAVVHVGMRVHLVFCLDLEFVYGDTRFSEYRQ